MKLTTTYCIAGFMVGFTVAIAFMLLVDQFTGNRVNL